MTEVAYGQKDVDELVKDKLIEKLINTVDVCLPLVVFHYPLSYEKENNY